MRLMWNLDSLQSLLRAGLKIGGGYLLAKGLADESAVEAITAGLLSTSAVLWGLRHRNPDKPREVKLTELPLILFFAMLLSGCAPL